MIKRVLLISAIFLNLYNPLYAYLADYPPYKFGEHPPVEFKMKLLVDYSREDYQTNDGKVAARLSEKENQPFYFILKVDGKILREDKIKEPPFAYAAYEGDLDKNGLNDYIVFSSYRGCGLASMVSVVDIYLKRKDEGYDRINYEGFAGKEDFTDMDKDGACEVIINALNGTGEHNYFIYNIYRIKDGKLINANSEFKGFPKVIWYTNNKNDKDTKRLTLKERAEFIKEMDSTIKCSVLKYSGDENSGDAP